MQEREDPGRMKNEELVELIRSGTNERENIEILYQQNRGMILKLANHYKISTRGDGDFEDLCQEGFFGLMTAVEAYDAEKGASFSTYAHYWIKASMRRYFENNASMIPLSSHQISRIAQYKSAVDSFRSSFDRDPSSRELSAILKTSPEQIEQIKKDAVAIYPRSIDEKIGEDESISFGETIESPTDEIGDLLDEIERQELASLLWSLVDDLSEEESSVLRWRYCDGLTLRECGELLGTNIDNAKKHEFRALQNMRRRKEILEPFVKVNDKIISQAYQGTGLRSFNQTWTSTPERIVMRILDPDEK